MPTEDNPKPKRRPAYRPFHHSIGFQIAPRLHLEVRAIVTERQVRFEDIYAEATRHALTVRKTEPLCYISSPTIRYATRAGVKMEPSLAAAARTASKQDHHRLTDFFQTAVHLYLEHLGRLPSRSQS